MPQSARRSWKALCDFVWLRYTRIACFGAAAALALAMLAERNAVPPCQYWADARDQCLVVAGLLLVPASIFPAVVGAMFPRYWSATPQTVVARHPIGSILDWLALVLGYSLMSLALPATGWLIGPLVLVVAVVALLALRAVAFSLALLDPIKFAHMLRDLCMDSGDDQLMFEAHGDLCRFVGGLKQEERRDSVRTGLGLLEEIWKAHRNDLDGRGPRARGLAERTLTLCKAKWPEGDIAQAVSSCEAAMGQRPVAAPVAHRGSNRIRA